MGGGKEDAEARRAGRVGRPARARRRSSAVKGERLCATRHSCKGAVATRYCMDCKSLPGGRKPLFCEACFLYVHPPHREPHNWVTTTDRRTTQLRSNLKSLARGHGKILSWRMDIDSLDSSLRAADDLCREQYRALDGMEARLLRMRMCLLSGDEYTGYLDSMARRLQEAWRASRILKARAARARRHAYARRIQALWRGYATRRRLQSKAVIRRRAAAVVQRWWRGYSVRRAIRPLIAAVYRKEWDRVRRCYYYYNTRLRQSSWEKPRLLAEDDDLTLGAKPPSCRLRRGVRLSHLRLLTFERAALMIQCAWRCHTAWEQRVHLARRRWLKVYDKRAKRWYYWDKREKQAAWRTTI
eukprot:PLAT7949.1.p1 GENE.PLAT7949.1~~PLAT7949.1.p1  ORF type:complete len:382 (-),score=82.53 PLAT7949.1:2-1069(-)